jgi:sugar/nucleoside kinase (ribokinase family)
VLFRSRVPAAFKDSRFVFLANTHPRLQQELLSQVDRPRFVAADTMDHWIKDNLQDLLALLKRIDCLVINEDEARLLATETNLVRAAGKILDLGVRVALIKKGASGSLMCSRKGGLFLLPAYPATRVIDPTGAGDSFAGGFMGHLAATGRTDFRTLRTAVAYGTVVASFTIADFSLKGLTDASRAGIDERLAELRKLTRF